MPPSRYKDVRALARGLDVLAAANRGVETPMAIAAACGLDRATVHRLLETMVRQGYLVPSASEGTYRPTARVLALSDGFRDESWITEHAVPALRDLLDEVKWPSDVATLEGIEMVARESTHRFSRLSVYKPVARRRLAMMSALGFAQLAFSPERERKRLLAALRRSSDPVNAFWQRRAEADEALAQVRRAGYAEVAGDVYGGIMALAVPVLVRGKPRCCLNVVVTRTAMPMRELAIRFLSPLKKAAERIAEGFEKPEAP
jgi:IclR family mhp operon transcriptional activator